MDKDEQEEWRDCQYYDGYAVSSLGNVVRKKDGLILKQYLQKSGYAYVWMDRGYGRHTVPVHRLVCIAFHGDEGYAKGEYVDHINTIRSDNRAENLHWVDAKGNANNPTTLENRRKKREEKKKIMKQENKLTGFDLMIGNYIFCKSIKEKYAKITEIYLTSDQEHKRMVSLSGRGTTDRYCLPIEDIEAVPLTEEILRNNGFEYHEGEIGPDRVRQASYYSCNNTFRLYDDGNPFAVWFEEPVDIRYVHELQNLLKLCGIKKDIKVTK